MRQKGRFDDLIDWDVYNEQQGLTPSKDDSSGATHAKVFQNPDVLGDYEKPSQGIVGTLANNPLTNTILGAGDALRNTLSFGLTNKNKSSSGTAYNIGNAAGTLAGFAGTGGLLNELRAAGEAIPYIGKGLEYLGGAGKLNKIANWGTAGAIQGAASTPGDRVKGALEQGILGTALMGGGIGAKAAGKGLSSASQYIKGIMPSAVTKEISGFVGNLGKGTETDNIKEIAESLQDAKNAHIEQYKNIREPFYSKYAKENIVKPEESNYLKNEDATEFYSKKGKLMKLHNAYEENPTLENYDSLQSELKSEKRNLDSQFKRQTLDELGKKRRESLNINISNLDSDIKNFIKTIPNEDRGAELAARTYYQKNVAKPYYQSSPVIEKLLNPEEYGSVTSQQVINKFGRSNKPTQKILDDIGEEGRNKILYAALSNAAKKSPDKVLETAQDLYHNKGFDKIMSPQQKALIDALGQKLSKGRTLKTGLQSLAGGAGGYLVGGPTTAALGAGIAYSPKAIEFLKNVLSKGIK